MPMGKEAVAYIVGIGAKVEDSYSFIRATGKSLNFDSDNSHRIIRSEAITDNNLDFHIGDTGPSFNLTKI